MNHSSIVLDNGCSGGSVMQIQLFVLFLCWYGLVRRRVVVSIFIGFPVFSFQRLNLVFYVLCFMFYIAGVL